jgi:hypothetical protein
VISLASAMARKSLSVVFVLFVTLALSIGSAFAPQGAGADAGIAAGTAGSKVRVV